MSVKLTSITDIPKTAGEKDLFGIEKYQKGLIQFIRNADTPITIAIQGEWGSGKTSLMNVLSMELCQPEDSEFYEVWINTWEYALLKDQQSTLIQIIKRLIEETLDVLKNHNYSNYYQLKEKAGRILKRALVSTTKVAANTALSGIGDEFEKMMDNPEKETSIHELRRELEKSLSDCLDQGKKSGSTKKGFVFFIDDLDRIDPPVAVQILELLKNIFDLKKCLFVLAIDYDVVVKGLKPKFGELTEKNEREFRSFFDKIIQLPFSMPVATYKIDTFMNEKLVSIGYLDGELKNDEGFQEQLCKITTLAVGTNPRSLKRLLNALSLIQCINGEECKGDEPLENYELLINFALVNIQIAYPAIYQLLQRYPNFMAWDEKIAVQYGLKAIDEERRSQIQADEYFDEEWEQFLYRFCERDNFLKKNARNISNILNIIIKAIPDDNELSNVMDSVISFSAVTSISSSDVQAPSLHKSSLLRSLLYQVQDDVKKKLAGQITRFESGQARIQSNLIMIYKAKGRSITIHFSPNQDKDGITLSIWQRYRFNKKGSSFEQVLSSLNKLENYTEINKKLLEIACRFDARLDPDLMKNKKVPSGYETVLAIKIKLQTPDDIHDITVIDRITSICAEIYPSLVDLKVLEESCK